MTAVKIAVIGAGSAQFTAGLINDLCRTLQPFFKGLPYLLQAKTTQIPSCGVWVLVSQYGLDVGQAITLSIKNAGRQVTYGMV